MLELLIALAFGAIHSHVSVGPTCAFAWGGAFNLSCAYDATGKSVWAAV